MADTIIDTLQVKVTANAQSASKSLQALSGALTKVRNALVGVKDGATVTEHLSKNLNSLNSSLSQISMTGIRKIERLASALDQYATAVSRLNAKTNLGGISKSIKATEKVFDYVGGEVMSTEGMSDVEDIESSSEAVEEYGEEVEKAGKKAKKAAGFVGKFVKSVGRILLYRAIRSALKGIGEAFETGLKNAYAFSDQHESFKRLADTLDHLKSVTGQMINQLGAFWGEVKQFVMPAIEWIVEKIRYVSERLTEFFAAMNGEHQYLYARYVEIKWDDATEAVKKYKHQLLGLDELNNLSKDDAKKLEGSKTSNDDYYRKGVNENVFNFAQKLKSFATSVSEVIKGITDGATDILLDISDILFNWDDLDDVEVAQKIITGLGGVLGAVTGFTFGGVPGAIIGTIAGVVLGAEIANIFFKDKSGEGEFSIGTKIAAVLNTITAGIIGWEVGSKFGIKGGVIGAAIGATLGFALTLAIAEFNPVKNDSGQTGINVLELIMGALALITPAIILWKVAAISHSLYAVGLTASIIVALALLLGSISSDYQAGMSGEDILNLILEKLMKAAMGGIALVAIVGAVAGNIAGMGLIFTIGCSLTLIIEQFDIVNKVVDQFAEETAGLIDFFTGTDKSSYGSATSYVQKVQDDYNRSKTGGSESSEAIVTYIKTKASGGIVNQGSLFYAGESGAEFVGNIGSTSAVANTGQMTDAIYKAAYMGMSKALKENGGGSMGGFEPATMDDLFIAMRKKSNEYNMTKGSPAFG